MHRLPVHHRKAAGFSGQPDVPGGILEQAAHENGREMAAQEVAAVILQGVRLRVQDIDTLRGGRHPYFGRAGAGLVFDDVGNVRRRGLRCAVHVHQVEGTVVRVEGLQAPGGAHPQDAAAVLEDGGNQVAGQALRLVAGEAEGREVHSVEPRETVFRTDPDEPAGVLENLMDLAAGKAGIGCIEPRHLGACRYQKC